MGNCGLKPKVNESDLAPVPAKEETPVEEVTKSVEVEEKEVVVAAPEEDDSGIKVRSLGLLFKEIVEAKDTPKDDKTEAPAVVEESVKEELKTEIIGDSSSKVATEEKTVPVVATPEPVKVEAPAVEEIKEKKEVPAEVSPVVEAPKVNEPIVATKPEASPVKSTEVGTEKVPTVEVRKEEVSPVTSVAKTTTEAAK